MDKNITDSLKGTALTQDEANDLINLIQSRVIVSPVSIETLKIDMERLNRLLKAKVDPKAGCGSGELISDRLGMIEKRLAMLEAEAADERHERHARTFEQLIPFTRLPKISAFRERK